jgi:2'-5' RNA ligase
MGAVVAGEAAAGGDATAEGQDAAAPGHTIGVVVAIPSPHREAIDAARERYEPAASDLPAHVTVLAPIDVDAEAMPAVEAHLARVAATTQPFRLTLRGTGTFRPVSPVVFVAVADGIGACEQLEMRIRSGDMAVETRYPYHPHVTLAHDVEESVLDRAFDELSGFEASIDVSSVGLYEYLDGRWHLVRDFPFGG